MYAMGAPIREGGDACWKFWKWAWRGTQVLFRWAWQLMIFTTKSQVSYFLISSGGHYVTPWEVLNPRSGTLKGTLSIQVSPFPFPLECMYHIIQIKLTDRQLAIILSLFKSFSVHWPHSPFEDWSSSRALLNAFPSDNTGLTALESDLSVLLASWIMSSSSSDVET